MAKNTKRQEITETYGAEVLDKLAQIANQLGRGGKYTKQLDAQIDELLGTKMVDRNPEAEKTFELSRGRK
jgi:hypothetical protein